MRIRKFFRDYVLRSSFQWKNYVVILGIVYSGIEAEIIPFQRKKRTKFAIFSLVLIDLFFWHSGKAGLWTHGLDAWTLGPWMSERLDFGRLDSGHLDAWTLDAWKLGLWTIGHRTIGHLDSAQMFSVYSLQLQNT